MKKIRLGVIGAGNMGTAHIRFIQEDRCPEFEVAAVADTNPAQLAWAREHAPGAALFDSAEALLAASGARGEDRLLDAVLIAVPHYDHPKYAMEAFRRGLHVMTEKPAGVYTRQVAEMNAAAATAGVVFGIMFNQRTDHIYRKMRDIVRGGDMGAIRRTSWIVTDWYRPQAYFDSGAWRATWSGEGGGVLLNQCPHNLDLWQWICGMPRTVDARLHFGKWHDIEVEDDVTCYVEYDTPDGRGATGTFVTSTGDAPGTNRFEITMDGGKLVAEGGRLHLWKLAVPEPEFSRANKSPQWHLDTERTEVPTDGKSEQHAGVLNAFADAILRGGPLVARGEEGINSLTLSNAMHLSAWTGRPVTLPLNEDLFYEELMTRVRTSRRKESIESVLSDRHSGPEHGK